MTVKKNIEELKARLGNCQLIAVSKTHSEEKVMEAYEAGHRVFGENKVQELTRKYEALPKDIEWHLIGHLQTNKVKYVAPFVALIHSVDSWKLLQEIDKQGQKNNRVVPCLLQIHIAEEETKFGWAAEEVVTLLRGSSISSLSHIQIIGLMGMATLTENREQIRKEFRSLRNLFEQIKSQSLPPNVLMKELSMGMTSDFDIAVEEGSTMVRIGSAIFGNRNYLI